MKREDFKHQLDELGTVINDGIAYLLVWRGLMVEDEESAKALNRYRGMFIPARSALLKMALMQFAKVFDKDTRAISLRNLLTAAQSDTITLTPHATESDLARISQDIYAIEDILRRLKNHRDQRIAHHDAITKSDVSITYGEVTKLVEDIKTMYNSLTKSHDRSTTLYDWLSREVERHTSNVVGVMREDMQRHIARYKKGK
jgi:hypothetical protein